MADAAVGAASSRAPTASPTPHSHPDVSEPSVFATLFDGTDLAALLLSHLVHPDYDTQCAQPDRSALRLLNVATRKLADDLASAYKDRRLTVHAEGGALTAAAVGRQAAAAMGVLGPLAEVLLEGHTHTVDGL